uniref:WAP domain-containing protein n=1 Tax=Sciurus vulgaris TaxID=55149 RepID=A0A8D2CKA5_SCIVU
QMSRANIMKWLLLQLLLLLCRVILPASGKLKERVHFEIEFPDYILSKPKVKSCPKTPSPRQCRTSCRLHLECPAEHLCCVAVCGNVCMQFEDMGETRKTLSPPRPVPHTVGRQQDTRSP